MAAPLTRDTVRARLASTQEALNKCLTRASAAELADTRGTPEWSGLDLLRHIWIWNELCARCLTDWHGSRDWILTFASEDEFNREMVAARAGADLTAILAGINAAYSSYTDTLTHSTDAELADCDAAPWGQNLSRLDLIHAELGHDLQHLEQLNAILARSVQ